MAIYTNIKTGERIKSTKNADGTTTKTVLNAPKSTPVQTTPTTTTRSEPSSALKALSIANSPTPTRSEPSSALKALSIANSPAPIESPVPASAISPQVDLSLPTPEATNVQAQFFTSATENLANTRKTYETTLKSERDRIAKEQKRLTDERDRALEGAQDQLTPFREDLEKQQREELFVNENFQKNQQLTNELETLLTEGNNLIRQAQGIPAAQSVVNARVNNAIRDVSARAGVIQAVMSARNSQIAQAYSMIDRSVAAITADRNDSLTYYETLIGLKNQDLLSLSKEDEKLANEQLSLAKGDLERAQASADYIKEMLINPETASLMADAGVTLLDTPEQMNTKIAEAISRQEIASFTNELTQAGYLVSPIPVEGAEEYTVNGKTFYAKVRPGSMLDMEMKSAQLGMEAQRASIAQSRASTANIYDQIRSRQQALEQAGAEATTINEKAQIEKVKATEKALEIKKAVTDLLNMPGKSAAVGFGFKKSIVGSLPFVSGDAIAGTSRADFEAAAERVKNLLTLDNLKLMTGVLTDTDIKILETAGSNLANFSQSEKAYDKEIQRVIDSMDRTVLNNGITPEQGRFWGVLQPDEDFETIWNNL